MSLKYHDTEECNVCDGSGWDKEKNKVCWWCDGKGIVAIHDNQDDADLE